jgi:hypothetical protein
LGKAKARMCNNVFWFLLAAADDEISFDPDDIITNVEMVSCFTNGKVL